MERHPVEIQIERADKAIVAEDFDALLGFYTEDAVLVIEPGRTVRGKAAIRKAFEAIAAYFRHGLKVRQNGMEILESGNTALVHANTVISAPGLPETERRAVYVFNRSAAGTWLCAIDNSYGNDIVENKAAG